MRPIRLHASLLAVVASLVWPLGAHADDAPPVVPVEPVTPAAVPLAAPVEPKRRPLPLGVRAIDYARSLIGVRYTYGGSSRRTGFDCSGFVRYVYAHFGVSLPH